MWEEHHRRDETFRNGERWEGSFHCRRHWATLSWRRAHCCSCLQAWWVNIWYQNEGKVAWIWYQMLWWDEININEKVRLKLPQARCHDLRPSPRQQVFLSSHPSTPSYSLRVPISNSLPWWNSFIEAGPATQKQVSIKVCCLLLRSQIITEGGGFIK